MVGFKIKEFHDLQTHLNRIRDFTGSSEKISMISSLGRIIPGDDGEASGSRRELGGGIFIGTTILFSFGTQN